jgi:phosphoribosylformimino-5-aminoimidazole carboxamide ribonucleotide (ProFAR) isomerase
VANWQNTGACMLDYVDSKIQSAANVKQTQLCLAIHIPVQLSSGVHRQDTVIDLQNVQSTEEFTTGFALRSILFDVG